MSFSKYQRKTAKDSSEFPEGEPVLTFHGPRMREGRCISVAVEDTKVKCLVRYKSGTGVNPTVVVYPPYAQIPQDPPSPGQGSAQEPESVASSSKGKGSTSRAGPSTSRPSTSEAGPSTSRPSTSEAGPSTSRPSTSEAGPSTSRGGQSTSGTSSSRLGGAMVQGASSGRSSSSGPISQGAGGASTSGAQSSASKAASKEAEVSGWHYEWIPENRVLRYSPDQLKQDSDTAIQMSIRKEQKQAASSRAFTYSGSNKGDHGDPGEGSTSGMMQPPPKRSRERVRSRSRRPWHLSSRGDAGDPKRESTGRFQVQVNLPKCLRPLLVQDWQLVTRGKKLCNLPAKVSVDAILSEYAIFPVNCRTRDKKYTVCGLVAVVKEYFNAILSTQLLYDFERPQYDELVVSYPSYQMTHLYGGAHLLRLFQQLGRMFTCTSLDDSSLIVLLTHLQDFLEYLASEPSLLFIDANDYELASEEYMKVAG